jgi:hypothetical protein
VGVPIETTCVSRTDAVIGNTSGRDHIHWRLLPTELKTSLPLAIENLIGRIKIPGVFSL